LNKYYSFKTKQKTCQNSS